MLAGLIRQPFAAQVEDSRLVFQSFNCGLLALKKTQNQKPEKLKSVITLNLERDSLHQLLVRRRGCGEIPQACKEQRPREQVPRAQRGQRRREQQVARSSFQDFRHLGADSGDHGGGLSGNEGVVFRGRLFV